ncbi:MAG TPA: D-alanine--D-alanine ligase family protein [Dehalococcoidia bacterium]|nr:D-alanine--D-alanine ligase family protein [Dehalococcoidia bacterium]
MPGQRLRVGIIFGGKSAEHEVSVVSAQGVQHAADSERFAITMIGVTRESIWLTPEETAHALMQVPPSSYRPLAASVSGVAAIRPQVLEALSALDVAFPLIHGTFGEDGTLQGMLELLGIPYVGAGVAASALGMDKALMKTVFQQAGLPVPGFRVMHARQWQADWQAEARQIEAAIGYPCFVKPANMGSSVGVSKVRSPAELTAAVELALRYDRKALAEQAIAGREIELAVLGNEAPEVSPPGEIIPAGEFYDYAAKYLEDSAQLVAPVSLPQPVSQRLQELAVAAFRAIDCAGMARVDFFLQGDEPIVNEINTIPGFTPISMYPKLWEAAGLPYRDLITRLIELALERHGKKRDCAGLSSK